MKKILFALLCAVTFNFYGKTYQTVSVPQGYSTKMYHHDGSQTMVARSHSGRHNYPSGKMLQQSMHHLAHNLHQLSSYIDAHEDLAPWVTFKLGQVAILVDSLDRYLRSSHPSTRKHMGGNVHK